MSLPPPTTSDHQNTLPFSATSTSTLRKSLSQRHCRHEFRFINCLKQDQIPSNQAAINIAV
ncbi:hypothetical protein glysoja_044544 [Glycine soja]|uniref:Uncharacterized protein n=1 Tax=Glycine soja TaxID=3848 RepID=A0A0B2S4R7_GLYSO|nr:hypothetical protein JHK87_027565 [Glycine soja]KHN41706.1 hypothetical protein glysoja_044544 [Glycine soja]